MSNPLEFIWLDSVVRKLEERGLSTDDVQGVVTHPASRDYSLSTGRPVAFGWIADGRYVIVVYVEIDELTVQVITAYEVSEPR